MKKFLFAAILFLGACTTVQEVPTMPSAPVSLQTSTCPVALEGFKKGSTMGDVVQVTKDNGQTYYACKSSADQWLSWYQDQQATIAKLTKK